MLNDEEGTHNAYITVKIVSSPYMALLGYLLII